MVQSLRYKSIASINGPLVVVSNVQNVKLSELVEIEVGDETRIGQVVELQENVAIVQVLQGTAGISIGKSYVRFTGDTLKIPVSEDIIGRTLNGLGRAIDGGPEVVGESLMLMVPQ